MDRAALEDGFLKLGLGESNVAVHASLKSFGYVDGGADAVVSALTSVCKNVMMPDIL